MEIRVFQCISDWRGWIDHPWLWKIYGVDEHWRDECSVQEYESKTITAGDNVYEGVDLTSCISYYKDLEDKNENQDVDEKDKVYEIQISDTENWL